MLDFARLAASKAVHDPFSYLAADALIGAGDLAALARDFPAIEAPGLFPLAGLRYGLAFARLVDELQHPRLRKLMEERFDIDLTDKPMMISVRGWCQRKDGRIHVDSTDKLATGLLYLNEPAWDNEGGRLRLLRKPGSLADPIAEIAPTGGTLLAFRRADNSWHGHAPFEGRRRAIMFNWMRSEALLTKNVLRHKLSALVKQGLGAGR